ncbi:signal peptidase I [Candidatus Beckwithbacteria bacterium CG10_big_fil_rev_8_21_14_0_10_34_10]|uniref:Signal peptidase I n=1 Tax=Candidatus Beckwithbacteria bacterium CG10_big_fil_rev_8_21_14_0_10_34_10 TaxID=1974495 RepID=A0A2H0W865_9BACT|nr:MAG: signal peptidase I [Candidatus Beckwithbacteria bacterium CG10_big_fil_rev_8_21_14_0_10_34_10]
MFKFKKKDINKKKKKIIYFLFFLVFLVIGGIVVLTAFEIPPGYKLFAVQSGSMSPAISTGSLIIIEKQENYKTGDIITFKNKDFKNLSNPKSTTTHRIIEELVTDEIIYFKTKGDANNSPEKDLITKEQILGAVKFKVPYMGYAVAAAKKPQGLVLLVVVPATIIVYEEFLKIKKELKRLIKKRKKPKEE